MEDEICGEFHVDLKKFQEWISNQPQLPQNFKPLLLFRYLKVCDFNHESARDLLLKNLEYRAKNPHLFTNRDMMSEEIQQVISTYQIYPLINFTKENHRITMSRMIDDDSSKLEVVNVIRWFFMNSDTNYVTNNTRGIPDGEIGIMDFKGFSWWHLMKVVANIKDVRTFLRYIQEAVPYKITQNHYVNCSPILSKVMSVIKPFVKKEIFDAMHFHTSGYESLHEFISPEILPEEYGGSGGPISKFYQMNLDNMELVKDYIKNDDNWKISTVN